MFETNNHNVDVEQQLIEVGVNIVSKNCDVYDCGNGEFALVPTKDLLIFIKVEKEKFTDAVVKEEVRKLGYGKAFVIKSYWKVATPPYPF